MANFKKVIQYDADGNIRVPLTTIDQVKDVKSNQSLSKVINDLNKDIESLRILHTLENYNPEMIVALPESQLDEMSENGQLVEGVLYFGIVES